MPRAVKNNNQLHKMRMNSPLRLFTFHNILVLTTCFTFYIERQDSDIIPNDIDFTQSNGAWIKTTCRNSCGARYFNTDNKASKYCSCYCHDDYSTFRMGATPSSSSCVKNEDIRKDSVCDIQFDDFENPDDQVPVLPDGGLKVKTKKCKIHGRPEYWDKGLWKTASDDLFEMSKDKLKWDKDAPKGSYSGRLMRQYLTKCHHTRDSCIVFKAGGTLKYNISPPTTTTSATTTTSTQAPTTITTTSTKSTAPPSTSSTILPTTLSTTLSTALPTTTSEPPLVTTDADTPIVTEQPSSKITETPMNTTVIPPLTEFTGRPTTITTEQTGTADKDARKGSNNGGSDGDKTLMIATVAAVTVIVCVVIICVFVWFVLKRRQKCDNKAYSSGMTVITNSTGKNNALPGNAVYCEPTDQHSSAFPKQLPHLGNPVYAKASIHAKQAKNNLPSFKMKTYKETNHYDNHTPVDDDEYACPNVKQANNKFAYNDYCYAEPEKPLYEELPNKGVRETVYQPLIRDSQIQDNNTGLPEYLTLVNDGQSSKSNNQSIPEYLTIIPDQPISQSPPSLEYDYAIPEDQRNPNLKRPGNKGLPQPVGNGPRSIQSPVYDILEPPSPENEYLAPVDGILPEK